MEIWDQLHHFNRNERWGEPDRMNGVILLILDLIRSKVPYRFHVNYGTQGKHVDKSQHYLGNAVDGYFIDTPSFREITTEILNIVADLQLQIGLGIYPMWKHPGFHFDCRSVAGRWGYLNRKMVTQAEALEYIYAEGL